VLCIFESDGESYFGWEPAAWVRDDSASRFLHLIHTLADPDSMRQVVARAWSRGAGWVYVTHDRMPNPWDVTPVYWDALIAAVEALPVSVERPVERRTELRAWPNPTRQAIRFELPDGSNPREIEILDGSGRLIARVSPGASPTWDGHDQMGNPVPAGIYFARVRGSGTESVRLALVR